MVVVEVRYRTARCDRMSVKGACQGSYRLRDVTACEAGPSNRRSRTDDDRGRGWFGDSRGHAEAARRGWEERGDTGSRGRGRDDDDRRRRSRGGRDDDQGQGGWFGDLRGHAEAARRG
jgi:hypothetical protein